MLNSGKRECKGEVRTGKRFKAHTTGLGLMLALIVSTAVLLPTVAGAQVLFLDQGSGERSDNDNYASFNFTIPTGTTLLVVGATDGVENRVPVSAWVGNTGNAMTHVVTGQYNETGHENGSLFYYANPPSGGQQIRVTYNGDLRCKSLGAVALANVDTLDPIIASKIFWGAANNENGTVFSTAEAPVDSFIVSSCGSQFTDAWGWLGSISGSERGEGHVRVYSRHVEGGLWGYWKHRGLMGRMGPLTTAGTDQVRYWADENWGAAALSVKPYNNQLSVTIEPAWARDAGARWTYAGGTSWYDSGDVLDVSLPDINGASYTIVFEDLPGINTPSAVTVTVLPDQSISRTGTYTDTEPPTGAIVINDGDAHTNSLSVALTLEASDTGSGMVGGHMRFSNDGGAWSDWEPYDTGKVWTLMTGDDGARDVHVQYRDVAGTATTESIVDSIVLDRVAPVVTVDPLLTNSDTPTLTGTVSDTLSGAASVQVEVDGQGYGAVIDNGTWSVDVTVALDDGVYDVVAVATDNAGNITVETAVDALTVDTERPTLDVNTDAYPGGTTDTVPVIFTLLFSEPVATLLVEDLVLTNAVSASIEEVLDDGATYIVHVFPETVGDVSCMLPENLVFDAAGNGNETSNTGVVEFQSDNPLCSVAGPVSYTNQTPVVFTIVFNVDVVGLSMADVEVTNGVKQFMSPITEKLYLLTVAMSTDGPVTCRVPAGAAFDAATGTLPNLISNRVTVIYDTTPPTVDLSLAGTTPTTSSTLVFTAAFNEDVGTSFTSDDITFTGSLAGSASLTTITKSGFTYTITAVLSDPDANGTLGITVGPDVEDLAGNLMEEAVSSPEYRVRNWQGFTEHPASRQAYVGDAHTLSVTVEHGAGTPSYQWWKRSADKSAAPLPGAEAASLVIVDMDMSNAGVYWCEVTYDGETESSNEATLTVAPHLTITAHPVSGEAFPTESFTFSVGTSGGYEPISYQWKKDGDVIAGAPNAEAFTLTDIEPEDADSYSVVVSDGFLDVLESAPAVLVVNDFPMPVSGAFGVLLAAAASALIGVGALRRRRH